MFGLPNEISAALIATITTAILFIIKEFADNMRARRQASLKQLEAFKTYTDPLLLSCENLYDRLQDIFQRKRKFLREIAPNNPFYQYRYISTLYRLCVILGWIQAIRRELSGMEIKNRHQYEDLNTSIEALQKSLAESQHMEGARLAYLSEKWNLELDALDDRDRTHMEAGIRQIVWDMVRNNDVNYAYELNEDQKDKLLQAVADLISQSVENQKIENDLIQQHRKKAVRALSRTEAWIYRDWQKAIGDLMLVPIEHENRIRRFEIMGFQNFEDLYLDSMRSIDRQPKMWSSPQDEKLLNPPAEHRWIERIDALFYNLDIIEDTKYDARIQQLKNLGSAMIKLMQILEDLDKSSDKIDPKKLEKLKLFDEINNPDYYQKSVSTQEPEPKIEESTT